VDDVSATGLTATAGVGDMTKWPTSYEEMHPGAYDAKARLKYMDEMGIWAMIMYPNVGGFGNQQFLKLEDPELKLTCVKVYNDWQTEWASADSRRLLPITSTPFWDVQETVKEVRRCAAMGHRGILFTGEPQYFGQPLLGDPHWNPLWEAAVELDQPISFHMALAIWRMVCRVKDESLWAAGPFTELSVNVFLRNGVQLNDLIMSGVLALSQNQVCLGGEWHRLDSFVLEALDYQFTDNRVPESDQNSTCCRRPISRATFTPVIGSSRPRRVVSWIKWA
jgi:predicted TIM-barrel fold metal-dependent hydrolase